MSADLLREAASKMRERATGARAGRWYADGAEVFAAWNDPRYIGVCDGALPEGNKASADHIASWHPAVALAVADWLDREAEGWDDHRDEHWFNTARAWDKNNTGPMPESIRAHFTTTAHEFADGQHRPALAVARAYLGGAA